MRYSTILLFILFSLYSANAQVLEGNIIDNDLPCDLARNFDILDLDSIKNSTLSWINGNQECVYSLLDKMTDLYIKNGNFDSFSCLSSVCNNSTGKISDYLIDVNGSIFYSNFAPYIKYLFYFKSNYGEEHCMVKHLISALSLQVASTKEVDRERKIITDYIKSESKKAKYTQDEINYVMSVYDRINIKLWE
jgi:hypothetical protein